MKVVRLGPMKYRVLIDQVYEPTILLATDDAIEWLVLLEAAVTAEMFGTFPTYVKVTGRRDTIASNQSYVEADLTVRFD